MQIVPLLVGQFGTNCYLVESNGSVGIIDPGDDGEYIIEQIEKEDWKPVWVVATHGHFDHVLAVTEVALTYQIPFYISPKDKFLLERTEETAFYFAQFTVEPVAVDPKPLGKTLSLGKEKFETIEAPGHTPGGVCLYNKKRKALFCGDLVFAGGGVGRTDFKYSSEEGLLDSIMEIIKLPDEVVIYPGHGESLMIKELKQYRF